MTASRTIWVVSMLLVALAAPAHGARHAGGPVPGVAAGENCLPAETAAALRGRLRAPQPSTSGVILYADPMGSGGINGFGQTVTNYVDLAGPGLLDWACGAVTYDGHRGIDIEIPSFFHMDEGVPIVAAAAGTVASTHDGEFDRNTQWQPGVTANSVAVQHADGSFTYYLHMRRGSVRVAPGQPVAAGDTLGMVGSSGFSTAPHLHFETFDGATIEPYAGSCNAIASRWASQGPYVWGLPFQLFGHGVTTLALDWPTILEWPPSKTHVTAGSTVYSWIRPRNIQAGDLITWRLFANGGLMGEYSFDPMASYSSSWWYIYWTLPSGPAGNWRFDILRNGSLIAQQPFTVDGVANQLPVVGSTTHAVAMDGVLETTIGSSDPDGSVYWHELATSAWHGSVDLFGGRRRRLRYRPDPGFTGMDSISVRAQDDEGAWGTPRVIRFAVGLSSGVQDPGVRGLALSPVSPNPVAGLSRITFTLPRASEATLELFDVTGHRVRTLVHGAHRAGDHAVAIDFQAGEGRRLAPGVYLISLSALGERRVRRVVVAR